MNLERYEYTRARTYKEYDFYSNGPKGTIRKVVRFTLLSVSGSGFYNLLMGDWDEKRMTVDDKSVTNNGDAEKVLATVAAIIVDFTAIFSNAIIYAEGSTLARTRRYQMGINKFWNEIEEMFYVCGYKGEEIEPFPKNSNYDAFLIIRKESIILKEQSEPYMTSSSKSNNNPRVYNDQTVDELVDISHTAFYSKKMEAAKKRLEKTPLPKELLKKLK